MKQMIQRMREEKGGFTLAELLIVVAIVAVLVAIAIPVFTAQLDKANAGTDEANTRSGYGYLQSMSITESGLTGSYTLMADGTVTGTGIDNDTSAAVYQAKGDSKNVDGANASEEITIGSVNGVKWTSGQNIIYTVSDGKIATIAGGTAPSSGGDDTE